MSKRRKYQAPTDWKVSDVVYIKYDSGGWQKKEIVGETSRSWLLLNPDAPSFRKDPKSWGFLKYCSKLPKCGYLIDPYGNEDHWQFGSPRSVILEEWARKNTDAVIREFQWGENHARFNAVTVLEIAKILGMQDIVASYPQEDTNVQAETSQSPAVEVADGDGGAKA